MREVIIVYWFVLGILLGIAAGVVIASAKLQSQSKGAVVKTDAPPVLNVAAAKHKDGDEATDLDIPIEIKPNLYSLALDNVSIKHHLVYREGEVWLDYIALKSDITYSLNGRKEGARRLIFTSYDKKGEVIEVSGDYKSYVFTDAGCDTVEVSFDEKMSKPSKISVSIREGKKD